MSRINGIGTMFLGISPPAPDGSCTATVWFTLFFLPLIPLRRERIRFVEQQGSGFSYQHVRREPHSPREILRTLLFCWFLIPAFAATPLVFAAKPIWVALGVPTAVHIVYIVLCCLWILFVTLSVVRRHEARCRPPRAD